jgi:hypothetical protein
MLRNIKFLKTTMAVFAIGLAMIFATGARADVTFVSGDVSGVWSSDSVIVVDSVSHQFSAVYRGRQDSGPRLYRRFESDGSRILLY